MSHWLELRGITRSFGSIQALKGVDLTVDPGEVIGLIGENGAGKSTLMKIMSGFDDGFEGELLVDGKQVSLGTPKAARALGIAIAQQELSLIPTLTVAENIFLGGDHGPSFASLRTLATMASSFLEEVGLSDMAPTTMVSRLSVGERHLVEVARLIAHNPRLLILDEPTAALGQSDSDRILEMVTRLKHQGKSVVYVSHRLDEIFKITDRCTVLRDGKSQISVATSELDTHKLVAMMLGRELENMFPARPTNLQPRAVYQVRDLWPDQVLAPVNFEIRAGEVLGLAGQLGSGAGEVLAAIAGAGQVRSGHIVDVSTGATFRPRSPKHAIQEGIAYCSPDRKHDGLFLGRPIRENLSAPNLKRVSRVGFIRNALESEFVTRLAKSFTVDVKRLDEDAAVLSGGNQQKVALGKWLSISPKVILVDEPTRGVDVGARAEIYLKIRALVDEGAAVVIASTDLLEIANLPDRVITFYKGAVSAELVGDEVTSASILENITNPRHLALTTGEPA